MPHRRASRGFSGGTQGMARENTTVTAIDQLATLYARPSERVLRKEIDHGQDDPQVSGGIASKGKETRPRGSDRYTADYCSAVETVSPTTFASS